MAKGTKRMTPNIVAVAGIEGLGGGKTMFGRYNGVGADQLNAGLVAQAQQQALFNTLASQQLVASDASGGGGVMGWWEQQSTGMKVGIGVGAVALVGAVGYLLLSDPAPYKANRRRRRYRRR